MGGLKEHKFCESDEFFREYPGPLSNETHLYYLKSEADKVIAELKKACNDKDDWCLHTLKENRHHKYKRCLAMADYAMYHHFRMLYIYGKSLDDDKAVFKINYGLRWRSRWLALAGQFTDKEAK